MSTRYVVKDGHTLGYIQDGETPGIMGVLAGDVFSGGHDPKNGMCAADPCIDELRPATLADFDRFRVCSRGYEL